MQDLYLTLAALQERVGEAANASQDREESVALLELYLLIRMEISPTLDETKEVELSVSEVLEIEERLALRINELLPQLRKEKGVAQELLALLRQRSVAELEAQVRLAGGCAISPLRPSCSVTGSSGGSSPCTTPFSDESSSRPAVFLEDSEFREKVVFRFQESPTSVLDDEQPSGFRPCVDSMVTYVAAEVTLALQTSVQEETKAFQFSQQCSAAEPHIGRSASQRVGDPELNRTLYASADCPSTSWLALGAVDEHLEEMQEAPQQVSARNKDRSAFWLVLKFAGAALVGRILSSGKTTATKRIQRPLRGPPITPLAFGAVGQKTASSVLPLDVLKQPLAHTKPPQESREVSQVIPLAPPSTA
ncbi:hypothetical protein CYMTET_12085 [Cymbomonas tetramitiformis]|uniref:Uncharacterized protein n=1 Tax=Cymbomonas tetramitiformis TaxID=36881 RepID=A0AAE0GL74_9CHLO|nr:hypothetical protein CYMTET_12085 [Cymbomonas tetramitiformis]